MEFNGDLHPDVIGTNPKYPPIVDHSWLNVDPGEYDNYPSDNNPVRVVPKLSDLWRHDLIPNNTNLIPNTGEPLKVRLSQNTDDCAVVDHIVKETKKAIMAGLTGKSLSDHLRARFSSKHIALAREALEKVADEIGLLGNVYIDVSVFDSYSDAENFLSNHRTRLAQDILVDQNSGLSFSAVSRLANKFHKNIVSKVEYNEELFKKYRDFLVRAGRIPDDMVIASREDLKAAFLYKKPTVVAKNPEVKKKDTPSKEQIKAAMQQLHEERLLNSQDAKDVAIVSKVSSIVSFVQENLSNGKSISAIKEMVRSKYLVDDIKDAADALAIVLSKEGLTESSINSAVDSGNISAVIGEELKKIAKKYPVKKEQKFEYVKSPEPVGVKGYFYPLNGEKKGKTDSRLLCASVEALVKGFEIEQVYKKLLEKTASHEEAGLILSEAIEEFNRIPAGVRANKPVKQPKVVIEEPTPREASPDPSVIASQLKELDSFFEGSRQQMTVEIERVPSVQAVNIKDTFNRQGIDNYIA